MVRKHYHEQGWLSPHRHYEALLAESLDSSFKLLDVGCGDEFPMAPFLARLVDEVHGVDPAVSPRSSLAGTSVKQGRAEQLPHPDGVFDAVTSKSVLEHLPDPLAAFKEFRRVLKPNGIVLFLTPSKYDWVSAAARVIPNALHAGIIRAIEGRPESDTFPTYYRANSAGQIKGIAEDTGFIIERLSYLRHYPYLLTFSPALCRVAITYDRLICRFKCLEFLRSSLLGLLRKSD